MRKTISWILSGLISLGVGLGIGLGISWGILPARDKDTVPATLNQSDKDIYRLLIADSFYVTQDLARAKIRLQLLDGENGSNSLQSQIERIAKSEGNGANQHLQVLFNAILESQNFTTPSGTLPVSTAKPLGTEAITISPVSSLSSFPLFTSTTNPSTPTIKSTSFMVRNRTQVCNPSTPAPLLQVILYDESGKQASGVAVIINSSTGSERILTGLKPELGDGYADFQLTPGILYSIIIEKVSGDPVEISAAECSSQGDVTYPGGWLLEIQY